MRSMLDVVVVIGMRWRIRKSECGLETSERLSLLGIPHGPGTHKQLRAKWGRSHKASRGVHASLVHVRGHVDVRRHLHVDLHQGNPTWITCDNGAAAFVAGHSAQLVEQRAVKEHRIAAYAAPIDGSHD